jgi:hypothetical protein
MGSVAIVFGFSALDRPGVTVVLGCHAFAGSRVAVVFGVGPRAGPSPAVRQRCPSV